MPNQDHSQRFPLQWERLLLKAIVEHPGLPHRTDIWRLTCDVRKQRALGLQSGQDGKTAEANQTPLKKRGAEDLYPSLAHIGARHFQPTANSRPLHVYLRHHRSQLVQRQV